MTYSGLKVYCNSARVGGNSYKAQPYSGMVILGRKRQDFTILRISLLNMKFEIDMYGSDTNGIVY